MANYDILGNIAIVKFLDETLHEDKLKKAGEIMNQYKGVKTVLEKINKVSGRLRTIKTNYLLGEKTLESLYVENGSRFKMNVETCYFSPRLAGERLEIAKKIKSKDKVLVMFSGVGPFSIVVAKHSKPKKIVSVELGKECCKYALENTKLNKVEGIVEVLQGDVKRIIPKLVLKKEKYDVVLMPRPNLKETFLADALLVCKKGTRIIYYGFCPESEKDKMVDNLLIEAKKLKRKLKITNVKEAGDIAPYEHRYRIEISVLN
jgi:tRNA (guanine37-N1)-methyltransferase